MYLLMMMFLLEFVIYLGTTIQSFTTGYGFLQVVSPFNTAILVRETFLAWLTSYSFTEKLLIKLDLIIYLK